MRRFTYKGKYNPINTHKYVGNAKNVTYRSMWERRFMKYCDMNTNVFQWSSEELVISPDAQINNPMGILGVLVSHLLIKLGFGYVALAIPINFSILVENIS